MTEDEFWVRLEFRICQELADWTDPVWKHVWCDGITGYVARPADGAPYVWGDIWIGPGGQTKMPFIMTVPAEAINSGALRWEALVPAETVTARLHVDLVNERVAIDLSKAEPIAEPWGPRPRNKGP